MSSNEAKDNLIDGAFITSVDVDVDKWREETIEDLKKWLDTIQSRTTSLGDPLVDFPDGWDSEQNISEQKQKIDLFSDGIIKTLKDHESKEEQADIQSIKIQAEKIKELEKILSQFNEEEDENEYLKAFDNLNEEEENILNKEIIIPTINLNAPNPFELDDIASSRLKAIDEKLQNDDEIDDQSADAIKFTTNQMKENQNDNITKPNKFLNSKNI